MHSPSRPRSVPAQRRVSALPASATGADIQALKQGWGDLEYLASRSPVGDSQGTREISKEELEDARDLALGKSLLIATQPEVAAQKISTGQAVIDRLRAKPRDPKVNAQHTEAALNAFRRLLVAQKSHVDALVRVNPFNKDLHAQGRSVLWRAAARLVPEGQGRELLNGRAGYLTAPASESKSTELDRKGSTPDGDESAPSLLHEPEQVARAGRKSKTVKIERGRTVGLANVAFVRTRSTLRINHKNLQKNVEESVSKHRVNERALAQASVASILKIEKDKSLAGKKIKDRFRIALNQVFKSRENPVIERVLPIPVRTVDDKASTTLINVTCRQEPARVLTASLVKQYLSDGIQGVNCHDDMQHQHALNLYRSSLEDECGRSLLSMIRHGVHSAAALTPAGIKALTDEELGKTALDLCDDCGDSGLQKIRDESAQATGEREGKYEVSGSPESTGYSAEGIKQAGAYVRRTTRYYGIPHSLGSSLGPSLLDRLRMAANQRRALESARAAITCLPPQELQRIAGCKEGEIPVVRLASLSLLTPDAVRGALKGPTKDEGLMWHDQQAAWQALSAREFIELEVPVAPSSGDSKYGGENAGGQGSTHRIKVKLDIAAFNIPVNKWGAHAVTGDFSLMVGDSHEANGAAITKLLGQLPRDRRALRTWKPEGWVGQALGDPALAVGQKDLLRALARQVAEICIDPDAGAKRQADPYRLVKRLLVLVHETGLAAPMVNCRSGKDRTSEAETQARQFALEARVRGAADLPSIDVAPGVRDEIQRLQLWNLQQGGGSREIQHWNTGFAGTKLKQPALLAQYGADQDKGLRHQYLGMSAHVSA